MKKFWWLWLSLLPLACRKKETPRPKLPPVVQFFVDSIKLEGESRLPSRFTLRWYGDDPDGYIVGYEIRMEGGPWAFTTAQESTFTVSFEPGVQYKDLVFELRGVDNDGLRTDPPARLRVPLKNSPPVCEIDDLTAPPDTALVAITISLRLNDPDGVETIDSLYIRIGSGPWTAFPPRYTLLTLTPQSPSTSSPTLVYVGTNLSPSFTIATPLPLDDTVRVYVRAKDQGGLFSPIDSTKRIYFRRKTADWLVLDSWNSSEAIDTLAAAFSQAWGRYDYWNLRLATQRPPLLIPTWLHIFRAYRYVCWIGAAPNLYELEDAETLIERYLSAGGYLFINFPLSGSLGANSPIFRWAPMDSISSTVQNGLLAPNSPVTSLLPAFPSFSNGLPYFMNGINPPYPKGTAITLYEMPNLVQGTGQPWPPGLSRAAAVGFPTGGGKFRQIFLILPLHQLRGDRVAFLTALQNAFQP
ncbi:MAG: hypothetical protein N2253_05325 [Bacteroidia bacterium]|nr:hypothetical protein [Bacteroidia bacterium]